MQGVHYYWMPISPNYKSILIGSWFVEWSFSKPPILCMMQDVRSELKMTVWHKRSHIWMIFTYSDIKSHFIFSCCYVPDSHICSTSLRLYTIVSCHAYCSGEADFDIMGCSLFCHIVASYRRGRGGEGGH